MNDQERLTELQRQIATAKGYTDIFDSKIGLYGVLYEDEGRTALPRWPWDIDAAWRLVREFTDAEARWAIGRGYVGMPAAWMDAVLPTGALANGTGDTPEEAICFAWCDWKGVDTSGAERQP